MSLKKKSSGFTLLEILIVIVILGVIAGLAIPVFTANIDKAKAQEAYMAIGVIRNSMITKWAMSSVHADQRTYAGATFDNTSSGYIGYDPNLAVGGQHLNFSYELNVVDDQHYEIIATCTTCGVPGTITTVESGISTPTGCFA